MGVTSRAHFRRAGELATMEAKSLTAQSKAGAASRSIYLQLVAAAHAESRVVASLATKLRIAQTTKARKSVAEAER
jgi:hypothetical protein